LKDAVQLEELRVPLSWPWEFLPLALQLEALRAQQQQVQQLAEQVQQEASLFEQDAAQFSELCL
jgi:hypothetical protein